MAEPITTLGQSSATRAQTVADFDAEWQAFRTANGYPDTFRFRQIYQAALDEGDKVAALVKAALTQSDRTRTPTKENQ